MSRRGDDRRGGGRSLKEIAEERMLETLSLKEQLEWRAKKAQTQPSLLQALEARKNAALEEEEFMKNNVADDDEDEEEDEYLYDEMGNVLRQAPCTYLHWDKIKFYFRHPYFRLFVGLSILLSNVAMYAAGNRTVSLSIDMFLCMRDVFVQILSHTHTSLPRFLSSVLCILYSSVTGQQLLVCVLSRLALPSSSRYSAYTWAKCGFMIAFSATFSICECSFKTKARGFACFGQQCSCCV